MTIQWIVRPGLTEPAGETVARSAGEGQKGVDTVANFAEIVTACPECGAAVAWIRVIGGDRICCDVKPVRFTPGATGALFVAERGRVLQGIAAETGKEEGHRCHDAACRPSPGGFAACPPPEGEA